MLHVPPVAVSTVSADGLAPLDAHTSANTVMTKFGSVYMGQVTKVRLSFYLVLLSNDSKTR